ncbi:hypothetical protein C8J57DRAFT_1213428 [Mycena rebaudengoi]|nr:hypothetical protein C8J57DRAFT_1213428 [Mycena rebaudengoi]
MSARGETRRYKSGDEGGGSSERGVLAFAGSDKERDGTKQTVHTRFIRATRGSATPSTRPVVYGAAGNMRTPGTMCIAAAQLGVRAERLERDVPPSRDRWARDPSRRVLKQRAEANAQKGGGGAKEFTIHQRERRGSNEMCEMLGTDRGHAIESWWACYRVGRNGFASSSLEVDWLEVSAVSKARTQRNGEEMGWDAMRQVNQRGHKSPVTGLPIWQAGPNRLVTWPQGVARGSPRSRQIWN